MATLTFYEKPGCQGNARQKALLRAAGHQLNVRNLLTEPWTPERLRQFFGALPVAQWFNRNAPAVKSGEVNPDALDSDAALALMVKRAILIRRPLLEMGDERWVGFDVAALDARIGLNGVNLPPGDLEACSHHGAEAAAHAAACHAEGHAHEHCSP